MMLLLGPSKFAPLTSACLHITPNCTTQGLLKHYASLPWGTLKREGFVVENRQVLLLSGRPKNYLYVLPFLTSYAFLPKAFIRKVFLMVA